MFQKVLLPTDGSENALKAAEYVIDLMKTHSGVEVTVLNVYRLLPDLATHDLPFDPGLVESAKEASQQALAKTVALFEKAGLKATALSQEGDPAGEIISCAKRGGYDHIVIGSRGMGAVSSLILGSVAQKVLYLAACPVIVIKT
jgi:nucleotide-binding universal stress UspA family protein